MSTRKMLLGNFPSGKLPPRKLLSRKILPTLKITLHKIFYEFFLSLILNFMEFFVLKDAATDMRYVARSKFSRSLVHKKNFSLI